MKKQILLFLFVGLTILLSASAQDSTKNKKPTVIPIKEAIDKGILELKVSGASDPRIFYEILDMDGVHYGKCMAIILQSKIDSVVLLKIDCGLLLIPTDDSVQKMIVTHNAELPLYPNTTYATRFYAMCSEIHKRSPNVVTTYRFGEMADSGLIKLAKYIEKSHMQNMVGQHAVWAYTDQAKFDDLKKYGADSNTIFITKEILNAVNLETALNKKPENIEEKITTFTINRYYDYGGLGLILILTITTITLIIVRKKKTTIKPV